jgi:uncharacterized membrane protein YebE (DUF533 family)
MIDADKIIHALQVKAEALTERLKTDPSARNLAMAGAGGLLAGILAGKASPRFAGAAAQVGGMAAIAGVAYYAWKRHQAKQAGMSPPETRQIEPAPAGFLPQGRGDGNAKLTLRAMINAAKADGRIDSEERARLFDRLGVVSLTDEEQAFLFEELARPLDTDGLVTEAAGSPGLAAQVYAASILAIEVDQPAERAYLSELSQRLGLAPELVLELHAAAA